MSYIDNLPPHVRRHGLACGWLYESRQGSEKPAKVPKNLQTGMNADPSNPNDFVPMSSLANFDFRQYGYDGIGLGIFDNIGAVDLDDCFNDDGSLNEQAEDVIRIMDSYTEISPSGRGIRILFLASNFKYDKSKYYINNQKLKLECYIAGCTNKYVSLTGNAICKVDLVESGDLLQIVLDKYMLRPQHSDPKVQLPAPTLTLDDNALLEKARNASNGDKFTALFSGDTSEYGGDDSAADMAMCNMLAFWSSRNAEQMDRLFRQSGLMREKWDRPTGNSTYGQETIAKAIAGTTRVYTPKQVSAKEKADPASDLATAVTSTVTYPVQVMPPKIISAVDLDKLTLPPLQVLVEGVLTAGTNILVGPSKARKSWLVLDMGLSIAAGNPWMGLPTTQCGVLYFALEDSLRRLQDRMRKVLNGVQPPPDFFFASELPTVDFGLFTVLDQYLQEHPSIKLIIIDTLQKVRGIQKANANLYSYDYKDLSTFQKYALKRGITFLFVHHTRKTKDADDVFNNISGSTGIMGVADTIWMISKKREDMLASLHITGRDVYEQTLSISFNSEAFRWELWGTVEESDDKSDEEKDRVIYKNSRVVKTVKKLLEFSTDGTWSGFASELIEKSTEYGINICATPQLVGKFLAKNDELFEEIDQISHWTTFANGQGSKKHHFRYAAYGDPTIGERIDPPVDDPDEAYDDDDELPSRQEDYRYLSEDATHDLLTENCQYD